jgi:hypothetical protein
MQEKKLVNGTVLLITIEQEHLIMNKCNKNCGYLAQQRN